MNSGIVKRSVVLNDHKTSISLEDPFWLELKSIAAEREGRGWQSYLEGRCRKAAR